MFSTGLTKEIYESFLRSHRLNRSDLNGSPFIYVDPQTGSIKLLASLLSSNEFNREVSAMLVNLVGDLDVHLIDN